ncbi:MAG: glycosyltransferase family 4 protein [Acidobacteria bacterium]|nr:glycosyltransferase family 4 protein [Acidobacteriota bacterium]
MRVLIDYRPALREPSGVGEYTHELARALLAAFPASGATRPLDLTIFSSSWKDRLDASGLAGATAIDRRVPVSVLNLLWHRLGWPPAETLTGRTFDVAHSLSPLLLPARAAAHVIMIHDLHFLAHRERTRAEIRRDYAPLARAHALRADAVIVPSAFTASEVERRLGVPRDRVAVCPPGAPAWTPRAAAPDAGYVLFFGTLEPRKNVGGLLDAYERLLAGPADRLRGGSGSPTRQAEAEVRRPVPDLVLAGKATDDARAWLNRLERPPLKGRARHIGYVDPANRRALYEGARLLVQPSFEEGFGITVLEAMTLGVPVVAADRGALPELLGDGGLLVDPEQPAAIADAIARMLDDAPFAAGCVAKGLARARHFRWDRTARRVYDVYQQAIEHRRCASA